MRKVIIVFIVGALLTGCSILQIGTQKDKHVLSAIEIVKILSSDEFEGREPGSDGMEKASSFVETHLKNIGIKPYFEGSFRDSLIVSGRISYNIVGKVAAKKETDKYILIGAHLDHLGKTISLEDSVYNGANDNASGVSAVLKIASNLLRHDLNKNVILSIFTEEESGLNGSRHLAKRLKADSINLLYVINFEMLGKPLLSDSSKIYITGFDKSNFAEIANNCMEEEFVKYESIDKIYGLFRLADNYPFYQEFAIPSHTLSTFDFKNFDYYHHVKDEFSEIDTEHLEHIIDKCSEMVIKLIEKNAVVTLNN
jgi:Iap family predicted aminopeptidase